MGRVMDVVVDLRKNSKTYLKHQKFILSSKNHKQIYIPPGFAHGFLVLSDIADFEYKCTEYYDPEDECSIAWNDPDIDINWPKLDIGISEKDKKAIKLSSLNL